MGYHWHSFALCPNQVKMSEFEAKSTKSTLAGVESRLSAATSNNAALQAEIAKLRGACASGDGLLRTTSADGRPGSTPYGPMPPIPQVSGSQICSHALQLSSALSYSSCDDCSFTIDHDYDWHVSRCMSFMCHWHVLILLRFRSPPKVVTNLVKAAAQPAPSGDQRVQLPNTEVNLKRWMLRCPL